MTAVLSDREGTRVAMLEVLVASFEDRYQWRFTDGEASFQVPIEDGAFFQRINSGERLGKGDVLRVELYEREWQEQKGLHVDRRILIVLGVIPAPSQLRF